MAKYHWHRERLTNSSHWFWRDVVGYIKGNGELGCTACYHEMWGANDRQTCSFVHWDAKPHADEACDCCGRIVSEVGEPQDGRPV